MSLMRAVLVPLASLVVFCGALGGAQAQQKPPAATDAQPPTLPAAPGGDSKPTIVVVDFQLLLTSSKSGKAVRQELEQKRSEYQKEMSREDEQLRKERDALQRQQASLSQDVLQQKAREFQEKLNKFDRLMQTKSKTLEHAKEEAFDKIQKTAVNIISKIAKDRGANLIFQRSALVLFGTNFDITDEVLQKLDEQLPTLAVSFVAPTATADDASPAAPAAAAAAPPNSGHAKKKK